MKGNIEESKVFINCELNEFYLQLSMTNKIYV